MDEERLRDLVEREIALAALVGGPPSEPWTGWLVDDAVAALRSSGENQLAVDYMIQVICYSGGWPEWLLVPETPDDWLIEKIAYLLKEYHGPPSWSKKKCREVAARLVNLAFETTREAAARVLDEEAR